MKLLKGRKQLASLKSRVKTSDGEGKIKNRRQEGKLSEERGVTRLDSCKQFLTLKLKIQIGGGDEKKKLRKAGKLIEGGSVEYIEDKKQLKPSKSKEEIEAERNYEKLKKEASTKHVESRLRLQKMKSSIQLGGGEARIEAQHKKGKLTARERINQLFDENSFIENQSHISTRSNGFGIDKYAIPGDGVVTGSGQISGRKIWVSSQDFTVLGGSLGEEHANRINWAQQMALKTLHPFIQLNDSGGARIQEGILALEGYGKIFRTNVQVSGVVPQISIILGPCAGGAAYSPALTDFVFMVEGNSYMYITGPSVIKAVTGEEVTHEGLGGAQAHNRLSGNAHFYCKSEQECFDTVKQLLSYLPLSNQEQPPVVNTGDPSDRETTEILTIIPEESKKGYDVRDVINVVYDKGSFLEVQKEFAANMVIGFARLAGRTVGIIANQPTYMAATLDIHSSDKASRFIRFCDSFNIPIISMVDTPGYMPGIQQEHGGVIRHGAKLLYAIAEATIPKISIILRKAFGGAYIAMASKELGYDRVLALPIAEIAVMGAEGAVNIIYRNEISNSANPQQTREEKIKEYRETFMNPYVAAGYGIIDDIIDLDKIRIELIRSLDVCVDKKERSPTKKHGNMPL